MALVNADRVKETTTTTGTGTLTLGGAVTGFQTFAAIGNANTCYCCCYAVDANGLPTGQWEVFLGTYTASGTTLARTTLIASSTGSAINFSAGTKHVIVCLPSQGTLVVRQPGGTVGLDEAQISHDGTNLTIKNLSAGSTILEMANLSLEFVQIKRGSTVLFQMEYDGACSFAGTPRLAGLTMSSAPISSGGDVGLSRLAAKVMKLTDGSSGGGWLQNAGGLSRVASAVTNVTTTPAAITGLSATLIAGRKYTGKLVVFASCATAADGLIIDFDGGAATMTSFQAAVTGNVQGATLGTTVSAALSTDLNATALNGTGVNCIVIEFGLVCNAAGTFIPRVAKNADAGGATLTVAANSFMELQDAP